MKIKNKDIYALIVTDNFIKIVGKIDLNGVFQ